ncbi:MAG TPA: hypothetical protein VLZ76_03035 [Lysobacter sp.]|nr:hypothetical protein [Lysobacter sp.]
MSTYRANSFRCAISLDLRKLALQFDFSASQELQRNIIPKFMRHLSRFAP